MFRSKKSVLNIKKGYVLIYTLVIGIILITIEVSVFTLEERRKLDTDKMYNILSKKIYNRETTEYLFLQMNNYVCNNTTSLDKASIQKLFDSNPNVNKIGTKEYYIFYSKTSDKFIICEQLENNKIESDCYDYSFISGKINYRYMYSTYS